MPRKQIAKGNADSSGQFVAGRIEAKKDFEMPEFGISMLSYENVVGLEQALRIIVRVAFAKWKQEHA